MSHGKSRWLVMAVLFCLLATVPAQGGNGGEAREVSIPGTGLALRVPVNVVVSLDKPPLPRVATLSVEVENIQSFPRDGVITKSDVLAQRTALARGHAKVADGYPTGYPTEKGPTVIHRKPLK